ncbi:MAG TPA: hypothetical protein VLB76_13465 [Thermoanaerobaculia bacterium]|nr:hypothetical protein [Thermoanaerobaculia bacterium]
MARDMMKVPASCKALVLLALAVAAALLVACGDRGPQQESAAPAAASTTASVAPEAPVAAPATTAKASASGRLCPNPPPCKTGHDCSNYPFHPTDCWTTEYGPAQADVVVGPKIGGPVRSTNMLYCSGNTYALCFFSGPPTPTGTSSSNKSLPCVMNGDTADCTCQAYTSGPNFVDINGILNRGAYFKTVDVCGQDGSRCKNIVNCGPRGDLPGCDKHIPEAPVCKYVKEQSPSNPQASLMPDADLISTFSFAMSGKGGGYKLGSTSCDGLYAGCMTAPCFYGPGHKSPTTDGELVECRCPTYNGVNQIGQANQSCSIAGDGKATFTWSSSNTVQSTSGQ